MRCARAVRKLGHFRLMVPDDQSDGGNYCVPPHGTAQIPTQSKSSDNEAKQTVFHTENAGLLSKSAILPPGQVLPRRWVGFRSGRAKAN